MYPETDVPPFKVTSSMLSRIQTNLPPLPDVVREQLIRDHEINLKLADQLADSDYLPLFQTLTTKTNLAGSFIATMLTETFKALERDGVPVQQLDDTTIIETFGLVDKGATAKESLADLFTWLCRNPKATAKDAIDALSLRMLTEEELREIVKEKIQSSTSLIRQLGQSSQGKLVGLIMAEVRGRADPKLVSDMVRKVLSDVLAKQ
jgi:glutamyl-tRNA(Gln) amidotransferase subunit E